MKSKRTKIWKRIVAILLVLSVVITDSSLWSITALADENDPPTTVTCNFNCTLPNILMTKSMQPMTQKRYQNWKME